MRSAPRRERLVVRHERGQRAVQRARRARRPAPGERVGAERDDLELRVGEDPVERLLAGVARCAEIAASA